MQKIFGSNIPYLTCERDFDLVQASVMLDDAGIPFPPIDQVPRSLRLVSKIDQCLVNSALAHATWASHTYEHGLYTYSGKSGAAEVINLH